MLFKYSEDNFLSIPLQHEARLETMYTNKFESTGNNVIVNYLNKRLKIIDLAHLLGLKRKTC